MPNPNFKKEISLWKAGYKYIVGIDEVGRGAWAGPIVAAGVIFEKRVVIEGLKDSKQMTENKRTHLADIIKQKAAAWTIQEIDNTVIDDIGVGRANALVIDKVLQQLKPCPDYALIDKAHILAYSMKIPWETIIKGDSLIKSIAAASILAKAYRDDLMLKLAKKYPKYSFEKHKGYGTKLHQHALENHNMCPIHRKSYKPISQMKLL